MKTKILFTSATFWLCYMASAQHGSLDLSFDPGTGVNGWVVTTSIQSDGKIIIGGNFFSYNGTDIKNIARLNTDASLDTSFDPGTGTNGDVMSTSLQSDGKIIIGGSFTSYNGTERRSIARLKVDGSIDSSFDPGTGANFNVLTTSIQSDGKIIIGGHFTTFNGTIRNRIVRLNTDGSVDNTFDPGTGPNVGVLTSSIQSDGKIIIGGQFTSYNEISRNCIARLNTDGSLDTSFETVVGEGDPVYATSIQSDGKIIIGGHFSYHYGMERYGIARLNLNGSFDSSFNPGTGVNGWVNTISIQSDGNVIIGGWFNTYNGTARLNIARLNTDGSIDSSFNQGLGASGGVNTTSIQSDGKIIIGGHFNSYNGTTRNRVARLYDCPVTTSFQTEIACRNYNWNGKIYTFTGTYFDTISNTEGCDSIMTLNLTINTVDVSVKQDGAILTAGDSSATYQWVDCDNNFVALPGETNQSFTATVNGKYAVVITQNNCKDTSSCYAVNFISVKNPIAGSSLQLFPNPFSTQTTLHSDHFIQKGTLTVYNSLGEVVTQITNINGQSVSINRGNLATGLYFIRLTEGRLELMMKKVIVVD